MPTVVISRAGVTQAWAGIASVNSNAATDVVSTSLVQSDSIIQMTMARAIAANSGSNRAPIVGSISPGVSFVIGTADGNPFNANSVVSVYWELKGSH